MGWALAVEGRSGGRGAVRGRSLLGGDLGAVLGQPLLQLLGSLVLDLLGGPLDARLAPWRVARRSLPLGLGGVEVLDDALVVLLEDLLGDALHAEDLDIKPLAAGERVLDMCEILFVHLVHVDGETCRAGGSQQSGRAPLSCDEDGGNMPPAVFNRLPHRSHLKCFAF